MHGELHNIRQRYRAQNCPTAYNTQSRAAQTGLPAALRKCYLSQFLRNDNDAKTAPGTSGVCGTLGEINLAVIGDKMKLLFAILIATNLSAATLSTLNSDFSPIMEKYKKEWMKLNRWNSGKNECSVSFRFTLDDDGKISQLEVLDTNGMPDHFKSKIVNEIKSTSFTHNPGEMDTFEYILSFQGGFYFDWKRGLIVGGITFLALTLVSSIAN